MSCEESDKSESELSVQLDNSDQNIILGYAIEHSEGNDNLSDNYSDFDFIVPMVEKTQIQFIFFKP